MRVHIHMYANACGGPRLALVSLFTLHLSPELAGPASVPRQLTAGSIPSTFILRFQGDSHDSHAYWALMLAIQI